jgi:hypothetical protein
VSRIGWEGLLPDTATCIVYQMKALNEDMDYSESGFLMKMAEDEEGDEDENCKIYWLHAYSCFNSFNWTPYLT